MSSPTGPPIGAAIETWVRQRADLGQISANTAAQYLASLQLLADHVGPDTPVGQVAADDVRSWIAERRTPTGAKPKPSTLNAMMAPARAMFADLHGDGVIPANPTKRIPLAKVAKRQPKSLTPEQQDQLLAVCDLRETAIVLLLLDAGLRRAEVAALPIEAWNRRDREITVIGKGDVEETVAVTERLHTALVAWVGQLPRRRTVGPMFESPINRGEPLHKRTVNHIVDRIEKRSGVEVRVTPHRFRHSMARNMFDDGAPANLVQRQARHASLATTSIYSTASIGQVHEHLARGGRSPRTGPASGPPPRGRRRRRRR